MLKKILVLTAVAASLSACGELVEVPPAFEGKILTPNGYLPDTFPPSTFRLPSCASPGAVCDKLVLVEKSDNAFKEEFTVFMPKNQLEMGFDLRMTAYIRDGKTDAILNKVTADFDENGRRVISFAKVYKTYAQPLIRDAARAVVAEYTIDQIASSRDAVNAELRERLDLVLQNTPVGLKTAGLARVAYPDVITKRKEQAEERRIEIEQEEARKQVELIKLQTELEKAKANRAIRREKAEAAAEENEIAAASITPEYLEYKKLEVLDAIANSGGSVFVPFDALGTVGLSQRIFNDAGKN
jgi:hypothetical protein